MSDDLGPDADPFFEANEGWGADALVGTRWILTATDEGPIALDRAPTLEIGAEGEISGLAGCNRYRGRAIIGAHHRRPVAELANILLDAVQRFANGAPQEDDMTVVLVKREALQ